MTHQLSKHSPLKDDRIFDREAHIEILFDGSITLWRSAANLDVVLAHFADFNCLELIVFHPAKNLEAPRMYIDCGILEQHLSLADMQNRIKERIDMFTRHHQVVVQENIEKDVKLSTFSNYVISRIVIKECEGFEVELQARFGDIVVEEAETRVSHLDIVVSRPVNLIPIHTEHLAKPE